MAQTNISIRVDEDVKKEAEILCAKIGLTLSAVTNVFYRQFVRTQGIPFHITAVESDPQRQALLRRQKATVKRLIESINADPLLDSPLDEILNQRVNITRELDL